MKPRHLAWTLIHLWACVICVWAYEKGGGTIEKGIAAILFILNFYGGGEQLRLFFYPPKRNSLEDTWKNK